MELFDEYFQRADLDRDGRISGAEATGFFQGSNLPKQVLAQIWTHADQNRTGYLSRSEFYNALKLVTVAQSKRELTPEIVKATLYGPASAKIPPPKINLATQVTSSSGVGTFGSNQSANIWPKMTPASVQKYAKVFMEVDADMDGKVTGEQARNLFLSWRIPKEVLKWVWDLSDQDNDSMLSLMEFCIALYLMERFKEGRSFPPTLPSSIMLDETLLSFAGPPEVRGNMGWLPTTGLGAVNTELFEVYFQRADLDRDGRISGAEAIGFFQGSDLPKRVLSQIWMYADPNHTGYLSRPEFDNALKLVTVAQSKRELTPHIVKAALSGPASAKIPPPKINLAPRPAPLQF